jgi:hypothetical protein
MKKFYITWLAVLSLTACNFSAGTKKDLSTGLSYSYNGFTVGEAYFVGPDNKPLGSNEVAVNTTVAIVLQGIENYVLENDRAFPGLSMSVTDKDGNTVLGNSDLFEGGDGYSAADASILRGTVTVGDPMVSGETYHVKMRVWDKKKPESEITAEIDIVVQ